MTSFAKPLNIKSKCLGSSISPPYEGGDQEVVGEKGNLATQKFEDPKPSLPTADPLLSSPYSSQGEGRLSIIVAELKSP
ncbi:hypothetical protein [Fodinibius halophilus]|uniref:Uncharacterized protein n=1 Tax=Fodinibius halophilus TaxID=1736908 RepID=A0A6M1T176_9BACT|nr:hypothetical protein [Fodinibius halophilus]NGP89246.1 hypothetical protein [Fodinibius halophilus]